MISAAESYCQIILLLVTSHDLRLGTDLSPSSCELQLLSIMYYKIKDLVLLFCTTDFVLLLSLL